MCRWRNYSHTRDKEEYNMKIKGMYCNISCVCWGVTGSPVVIVDTNQNDWSKIGKIIEENALKYPQGKFIINPVILET